MLPAGEVRIYLACGVTDMRGGFHSLAVSTIELFDGSAITEFDVLPASASWLL